MKIIRLILIKILNIFFIFVIKPEKNIDKNLQKTLGLYQNEGGFAELFSKIRVWDAPYEELDSLIKKNAKIIDLGSGDGLLGNYLAISSSKRKVFGVEINEDRVKIADKRIKNAKFKKGDVLKTDIRKYNQIILSHVLHHLPSRDDQIKLLEKISTSLKKGDRLLILEIDNKPFLKYLFTFFTDAVIVPILFEKKLVNFNFYYRKSFEWKKELNELGFNVKIRSVNKGMPFSHVLINCEKN